MYDAAVKKVPEKERLGVYDIYIARASELFGIGKVSSGAGGGGCTDGGGGAGKEERMVGPDGP